MSTLRFWEGVERWGPARHTPPQLIYSSVAECTEQCLIRDGRSSRNICRMNESHSHGKFCEAGTDMITLLQGRETEAQREGALLRNRSR